MTNLSYIWIIEPHSSGYPHLHIVIFSLISINLQEKIRLLWSQKYVAGSKLHVVDFVTRTPEEDIESRLKSPISMFPHKSIEYPLFFFHPLPLNLVKTVTNPLAIYFIK